MTLVGGKVAGAEQDGEDGKAHGNPAIQRPGGQIPRAEGREGDRDGLQLQRQIGRGRDQRDQGDQRRQRVRLAEAGRNEVGDRGDTVQARDPHQPPQPPPASRQHDGRTKIDRREFQPRAAGIADRAVKRPGRAIDRKRQRIDDGLVGPPCPPARGGTVGSPCDREQQPDIAECGQDQRVKAHLSGPLSAADGQGGDAAAPRR